MEYECKCTEKEQWSDKILKIQTAQKTINDAVGNKTTMINSTGTLCLNYPSCFSVNNMAQLSSSTTDMVVNLANDFDLYKSEIDAKLTSLQSEYNEYCRLDQKYHDWVAEQERLAREAEEARKAAEAAQKAADAAAASKKAVSGWVTR